MCLIFSSDLKNVYFPVLLTSTWLSGIMSITLVNTGASIIKRCLFRC